MSRLSRHIFLLFGLMLILPHESTVHAEDAFAPDGFASLLFIYEGQQEILDRNWQYGAIGVPGETDDDGDAWQFEVAAGFDEILFSFFEVETTDGDLEPFIVRFSSLDEGGSRIKDVIVDSSFPVDVTFLPFSESVGAHGVQPPGGFGEDVERLLHELRRMMFPEDSRARSECTAGHEHKLPQLGRGAG